MTRRSVRFAFAALIGTVLVAVVLTLADENRSRKNLTELGADKNTALALSISNAARMPLQHLLDLPTDLTSDGLRHAAAADELRNVLDSLTRNLSIVKVKVYNRRGTTIFSTDPDQIGKAAGSNPGFITAMVGGTISEIVRRDTLNPFDQIVERRDLIQTYLPVRGDGGKVIGVFEVYSDITPLLARIAATRHAIVGLVAGILGVFYVLLVWLYRRVDMRLIKEEAATSLYLKEIEAANTTLEDRVAERTEKLEKLRHFLQTALDGVPDPAIVIDKNYRVTSMNKAARIAFDADKKKPEELCCYSVMHGRDAPCDDPAYLCTLTSGAPYKIVESRTDAKGRPQDIEIRTIPLRGSDGATSGAIAVMHDMNEREQSAYKLRQAKERAETSSQVKSEFVAMMSHEIRTPMNAVLGMTDLLRLTELTRKQQGYIQTIQSSGNMLLSLVDNILDFSRLEAGALDLQLREFSVIELLEQVLKIMGYAAYVKGLELALDLDAGMQLRVTGDANRLCQILVNLVSNAIKFSEHGEIVVSLGTRPKNAGKTDLLFSVTDRGIGISDAVKKEMFTPFTRVAERAAGKQQGTGIGLAICKQLIEHMGGEIGVDSRSGEGTRVWFTVPAEISAPTDSDLGFRIPALHGKRILMVCENPSLTHIYCSYTEDWEMRCDCAMTAGEALALLQSASTGGIPYSFAVIDRSTNGLDGLHLIRRIRSMEENRQLPVILLTPISQPLEPGEISATGRVLCVNKPVLPSELRLALFKLMGSMDDRSLAGDVEYSANGHNDAIRILVAEDNLVNRRVLIGMLNSLDYSADCIEDGPSVLTALEETPYDVVLMDCQMPGMDGEEVTRRIRKDWRRYPKQPVIVAITADASLEHRSACLDAGMDDFIAKPIRLAKLRKGLQHWKTLAAAGVTEDSEDDDSRKDLQDQQTRAQLRDRAAAQDTAFLNQYIDLFLEDTALRLNSLEAAFRNHDLDALRRDSHALKGACLEFGVVRMGQFCDELRLSAADEKFDELPNLLDGLRKEFDRIKPVLEAEKANQPSQL